MTDEDYRGVLRSLHNNIQRRYQAGEITTVEDKQWAMEWNLHRQARADQYGGIGQRVGVWMENNVLAWRRDAETGSVRSWGQLAKNWTVTGAKRSWEWSMQQRERQRPEREAMIRGVRAGTERALTAVGNEAMAYKSEAWDAIRHAGEYPAIARYMSRPIVSALSRLDERTQPDRDWLAERIGGRAADFLMNNFSRAAARRVVRVVGADVGGGEVRPGSDTTPPDVSSLPWGAPHRRPVSDPFESVADADLRRASIEEPPEWETMTGGVAGSGSGRVTESPDSDSITEPPSEWTRFSRALGVPGPEPAPPARFEAPAPGGTESSEVQESRVAEGARELVDAGGGPWVTETVNLSNDYSATATINRLLNPLDESEEARWLAAHYVYNREVYSGGFQERSFAQIYNLAELAQSGDDDALSRLRSAVRNIGGSTASYTILHGFQASEVYNLLNEEMQGSSSSAAGY
jgi:hypothetical protein